jgi:drug/metabolite transporter (DMT)-like permease
VQLAVPVLAALGGVALLDERLTPRLAIASIAVLGGISLVIARRGRAGTRPGRSGMAYGPDGGQPVPEERP